MSVTVEYSTRVSHTDPTVAQHPNLTICTEVQEDGGRIWEASRRVAAGAGIQQESAVVSERGAGQVVGGERGAQVSRPRRRSVGQYIFVYYTPFLIDHCKLNVLYQKGLDRVKELERITYLQLKLLSCFPILQLSTQLFETSINE